MLLLYCKNLLYHLAMNGIEEIACKFVFVEFSLKILNGNFAVLRGVKFVPCQCLKKKYIF